MVGQVLDQQDLPVLLVQLAPLVLQEPLEPLVPQDLQDPLVLEVVT